MTFRKGQKTWNKGKKNIFSDETIKKMRLAKLGKKLSEEHKKNIGKSGLGRVVSIETRRKISQFHIGRRPTKETLKKLSQSHIGIQAGENHPMYGKHHKEDSKQKNREKHIGKLVGEKNPSWKGGITPLVLKIRHCLKYMEWRLAVFQNDDYTCQECKKRGGIIHADHIIPLSKIMKDHNIKTMEDALDCQILWDKSNGRTLCLDCHKKTETWGWKALRYER